MTQPTATEVVALLGIDPSTLPLAPADLASANRKAGACVRCGTAGAVMLIASTALGTRWVDMCNPCFRWATVSR